MLPNNRLSALSIERGGVPLPNQGTPRRSPGSEDRFALINHKNLNLSHYTQSLISEALRVGLLSMETVDDVQMQVMGRLELLIREQTKLTGTAVNENDAKALLDSIFCTLDAYLFGFHDPMYAITAVQSTSVDEMFTGGRHQLKAQLCESVSLYVQVKHTRVPTESLLYSDTLNNDIRTYLDSYDYKYAADRIVCRLRYPLSREQMPLPGIGYLRDYLRSLLTENKILALFDPEELSLLFRSHAALHHTSPAEMKENLFSVVMHNALGAALLGKYTGILTLTPEEIERLYSKLYRKTTRELEAMTAEAVTGFLADLHIYEPAPASYIRSYAKGFVGKLVAARTLGEESMLFVPSDPLDLFKQ